MSLKHALLAVLSAEPMTGYDLVRYFDGTVAFVWNAPHSQIYPELRRLERDGMLDAEVVPRGDRAEKRVYSINHDGLAELVRWANELIPLQAHRDVHRLKAAYMEFAAPDSARRQLEEHLNHYMHAKRAWERLVADIDARRVPLLQRRLERTSEHQHAAIVAFKRFAFGGEIARAKAEIEWAEEGLALLDELERSGTQASSTNE